MSPVREAWTDDRLDDLSRRVSRGFDRVDADVRGFRAEMNRGFDRVDARFDAMQRTLLQVGGGLIAAIVASAIASQL